jgi:hypothetical protein
MSVEEGVYPQVESLCGTTTSSRTERTYIIPFLNNTPTYSSSLTTMPRRHKNNLLGDESLGDGITVDDSWVVFIKDEYRHCCGRTLESNTLSN